MKKIAAVSLLVLTAATGAFAQTTAPKTPVTTPAATPAAAPATTTADAATEAKFKAADKSGKGFIQGGDLTPYKDVMSKVDTDKDGKISKAEFAAAVKSGVIK